MSTFVLRQTGSEVQELLDDIPQIKNVLGNTSVNESLTESTVNGYYSYSSTALGTATTATKTSEGGWRCIAQPVISGEKYIITGTGGAGARLYCLVNSDGIIKAIAESGEVKANFELTVEENGTLYCSFNKNNDYGLDKQYTTYTRLDDIDEEIAAVKTDVAAVQRDIQALQESIVPDLEENIEDLTSSVISGFYTYSSTAVGTLTSATRNYDGSWRCIAQPVVSGEKYVITGTGGAGARLYCLVNSSNVIKAIAGSGEVQSELELVVEENGTLYCSFDNSHAYSVVRKFYTEESNSASDNSWRNGSYEFGRTCNCDYTAPIIPRYSFPNTGKVAYIYGLYDALVSKYPRYVFREDCDSVMSSLGISKPQNLASLPMYMYKFIPPKAPNSSGFTATDSDANMIKAFVITGAHNEFVAIWDCYNAMRLICESWGEDKNLEELRWNAEIYVIPCYNLYGVDNSVRTNENGVDLNRNAPTIEWHVQGEVGDNTYSGPSAGSEYSTKVMMHYFSAIKPQIFIDHHNTNVGAGSDEGDGKNFMYTHSVDQIAIDLSSVFISQMTRKWKKRFTDIFPSVEADPVTLFGYTLYDHIKGSIGRYGSEQGALGSTFETNFGILYKNGEYSTNNRQNNTDTVATCATEGFLNYLLRSLKVYSEEIGVQIN